MEKEEADTVKVGKVSILEQMKQDEDFFTSLWDDGELNLPINRLKAIVRMEPKKGKSGSSLLSTLSRNGRKIRKTPSRFLRTSLRRTKKKKGTLRPKTNLLQVDTSDSQLSGPKVEEAFKLKKTDSEIKFRESIRDSIGDSFDGSLPPPVVNGKEPLKVNAFKRSSFLTQASFEEREIILHKAKSRSQPVVTSSQLKEEEIRQRHSSEPVDEIDTEI